MLLLLQMDSHVFTFSNQHVTCIKLLSLASFFYLIKSQNTSQDLQKGLDLGLVSPEVLQNFFDLEQYPLISELTHRFQVSCFSE